MVTVQDILDRKGSFVACMDSGASVLEATRLMNERRIGALVICENENVVGIFSERDVLSRVVAEERDPRTTKVGKVMTHPLACCVPETSLEECKEVMTAKRIRHLPVVKDHELLGIITSGDVLYLEKKKGQETIKYLKEYIHGPYSPS